MPKLVFRVASDWEEVVKLRNEIAKLKQELKGMDSTQSPADFKTLNTQLAASTQRMDELVTNAAKAGAEMETGFKRKIFAASQSVNGFTEKIIAQKAVVKDVEADVKRLGDAYRTALKRNPLCANSKLAEYTSAKKALDEEKSALFGLTQEQANARLSVKKLRDEYSLYKDDAKGITEVNNGITISWKQALGVIGGAAMLKSLVSDITHVRMEIDSVEKSFAALLKSEDKAKEMIGGLKELSIKSGLNTYGTAQTLLGFNVDAEKILPTLKSIGDITMGNNEKFSSMTLAFAQMSAAGRLMGQDLNQMINAGFNPLQVISEKTGKSIAVLKKEMEQGAISSEMVADAFATATAEGGRFYNMLEKQNTGIRGEKNRQSAVIKEKLNEIGEANEKIIAGSYRVTTFLIENYETIGKILVGLVATYGTYRTAVMLVTAADSKHTLVEIGLTNARILARKAQLALNAAMLTNPYVLLAVAVGGLATAMWAMSDSTTAAARAQKEYNDIKDTASKKEQKHKQKIEELLTAARDESLATLTRQKSLEELRKEYPKIFGQYDIEKLKLEDILKLKQQINEEDSNRSVQGRKDDYTSLKLWYYTLMGDLNTQFAKGYNYPDKTHYISNFFAPAYSNISVGMEYRPKSNYSVYLSPASTKMTFVEDDYLSELGAFGVDPGDRFRMEWGAYLKARAELTVMENVNLITTADFFTPYSDQFGNIDVNWDVLISMKINKFLSATLNTTLKYDNDVKTFEDNGEKRGAKVQFKEILGIGVAYNF